MGDVALVWLIPFAADIAVTDNDLLADDGLETAVSISLFTDRLANVDDELPANDSDRRGWWGDFHPDVPNDQIGSRLWLLAREKQLPIVLVRAKEYCDEALAWMVDDGVASGVIVTVTNPTFQTIDIEVAIYRPNASDPTRFRYNYAWQSQAAKSLD